jgi:hypothetical protein
MWRKKLSAVSSSSSASPRRCQTALSMVRVKTRCFVSAGVKARKSCSPISRSADSGSLSSSSGLGYHQLRWASNGEGVRRR